MKRFAILAAAVATAAVTVTPPPPAVAAHGCNGSITAIPVAGQTFYVDDRSDRFDPTSVSIWVYQESNAAPGLQSGGRQAANLWSDECEHADPDRLLF